MDKVNPFRKAWQKAVLDPFRYRKHSLVVLSFPVAIMSQTFLDSIIQISQWYYHGAFLGISVSLIAVLVVFMVADFFTGVSASNAEGEEFNSGKLTYTFYKFLMYFFFFWLMNEIHKTLITYQPVWGWLGFVMSEATHMISFVRTFIFIILIFREFISIGENIERRFGKRPYIFTLAQKLVDIIEKKFINRLEKSGVCGKDETDKEL